VITAFGEMRRLATGDVIVNAGQALATWLRIKAGEVRCVLCVSVCLFHISLTTTNNNNNNNDDDDDDVVGSRGVDRQSIPTHTYDERSGVVRACRGTALSDRFERIVVSHCCHCAD
jgi:hypothetical protein